MNFSTALSPRLVTEGIGGVPRIELQAGTEDSPVQIVKSDCVATSTTRKTRYKVALARQYRRTLDIPVKSVAVTPADLTGPDALGVYVAQRYTTASPFTIVGASDRVYSDNAYLIGPAIYETLFSWTPGFLGFHLSNWVSSAIATAGTFADSKRLVYSSQDHGAAAYVRNPALWCAALDLTGCSPWNSYDGPRRAGTLISPRHFAHASHYTIPNRTALRFVANDGTVHTRTVVQTVAVTSNDIQVGVLDSDLPASVKWYKILPANWRNWVPNLQYGLLALTLDQEEKALVGAVGGGQAPAIQYGTVPDSLKAWNETLISGDSGNPLFFVIGGELMLVTTHLTAASGPDWSAFRNEINAAMTALGGGYQAQTADLSAFPIPT